MAGTLESSSSEVGGLHKIAADFGGCICHDALVFCAPDHPLPKV
jgi:hypothetical protein